MNSNDSGEKSTVDFGYKERGYKEQPLIWNKCQRDGYKEQSPVIWNTTMRSARLFLLDGRECPG